MMKVLKYILFICVLLGMIFFIKSYYDYQLSEKRVDFALSSIKKDILFLSQNFKNAEKLVMEDNNHSLDDLYKRHQIDPNESERIKCENLDCLLNLRKKILKKFIALTGSESDALPSNVFKKDIITNKLYFGTIYHTYSMTYNVIFKVFINEKEFEYNYKDEYTIAKSDIYDIEYYKLNLNIINATIDTVRRNRKIKFR